MLLGTELIAYLYWDSWEGSYPTNLLTKHTQTASSAHSCLFLNHSCCWGCPSCWRTLLATWAGPLTWAGSSFSSGLWTGASCPSGSSSTDTSTWHCCLPTWSRWHCLLGVGGRGELLHTDMHNPELNPQSFCVCVSLHVLFTVVESFD